MSKKPVRVAVTGAAGQIGYALLFRIASGEMLGKDQPVILQLLEIPDEKAQKALKGVMMELEDCAFPLLAGMEAHSDPMTAFKDTDYALLVGSRPRGPGMERAELLAINGAIFTAQGKALNAVASRDVKVLVVGNPALEATQLGPLVSASQRASVEDFLTDAHKHGTHFGCGGKRPSAKGFYLEPTVLLDVDKSTRCWRDSAGRSATPAQISRTD